MGENSDTVSGGSNLSSQGVVSHYRFHDGSSQFDFLQFDNDMRAMTSNQPLSFTTETYVHTVASCNGLLLLLSTGEKQLIYHVFDPLTKQTITSLLQPCIPGHVICSGLAFDGHNYQVVLAHVPNCKYSSGRSALVTVEFEIFSSKTQEWRRHTPSHLSLPFHPPTHLFSELATPPLFSNDAIHWEICGSLLVCNVQADYCKLIKLPTDWCCQSESIYRRCLWESDSRVHYTYTDSDGVHTWVLLTEYDLDHYSIINIIDRKENQWKLVHSLHHKALKESNPKVFEQGTEWEPHYLSAFAYNEASQTMYMQLPGIGVYLQYNTRVLEQVCTYKFPGKDFNCCSFLPFVFRGQSQPPQANIAVELPIGEVK